MMEIVGFLLGIILSSTSFFINVHHPQPQPPILCTLIIIHDNLKERSIDQVFSRNNSFAFVKVITILVVTHRGSSRSSAELQPILHVLKISKSKWYHRKAGPQMETDDRI